MSTILRKILTSTSKMLTTIPPTSSTKWMVTDPMYPVESYPLSTLTVMFRPGPLLAEAWTVPVWPARSSPV